MSDSGAVDTTSLRVLIRQGTHVERLFRSFVMSPITGITLVVTLTRLVLLGRSARWPNLPDRYGMSCSPSS
jgi:hypothetical protein